MPVKRVGKGLSLPKLENAQKRSLILSAKLVAQRATNLAPILTGRLKRSITNSQPRQLGKASFEIDVGTNVEYAPFQEFGTKFMKAQPYLAPALKASRKDIVRIFTKNIVAAMKQ